MPRWGRFCRGRFIHIAFDGGAECGVGCAGYIIADASGRELVRRGVFLGDGVTNNEAESTALLLAL